MHSISSPWPTPANYCPSHFPNPQNFPGEERRLFVPAKLAYADRGVCFDDKSKGCLVPPNTDLVYDVTLIQVAPPPI